MVHDYLKTAIYLFIVILFVFIVGFALLLFTGGLYFG